MTREGGCFQQALYDAGEVAIPINDGLASKEGGFAAFVGFFRGSVRFGPEGFEGSGMGVLNFRAKASRSKGGEWV